ncbi:MAG TPA: NUDIX hydrolase [Herpetosiphonaceae bacterium]|nr:NUDIX hydrolase [Herpetosiphonaceae bacterium]
MDDLPAAPYDQSGAIPYRWNDGRLEVLLITSRRTGRWIIPKGMVEPGLGPALSAAEEAYEEAGVHGALAAAPLGSYAYAKQGYRWTVSVYALAVESVLERWPEMRSRRRAWHPVEAAATLADGPGLQALIAALRESVASNQ